MRTTPPVARHTGALRGVSTSLCVFQREMHFRSIHKASWIAAKQASTLHGTWSHQGASPVHGNTNSRRSPRAKHSSRAMAAVISQVSRPIHAPSPCPITRPARHGGFDRPTWPRTDRMARRRRTTPPYVFALCPPTMIVCEASQLKARIALQWALKLCKAWSVVDMGPSLFTHHTSTVVLCRQGLE
jgi:hypothetical protein